MHRPFHSPRERESERERGKRSEGGRERRGNTERERGGGIAVASSKEHGAQSGRWRQVAGSPAIPHQLPACLPPAPVQRKVSCERSTALSETTNVGEARSRPSNPCYLVDTDYVLVFTQLSAAMSVVGLLPRPSCPPWRFPSPKLPPLSINTRHTPSGRGIG